MIASALAPDPSPSNPFWRLTHIDTGRLEQILLAFGILLLGWFLAGRIRRLVEHLVARRMPGQRTMIAGRVAYYLVLGLALLEALHSAGVQLSVLLGAAGLLTVAIGFAAQTSVSNLISGLFLMGEKPFIIGDSVRFGTTEGEVVSIDLLSVKIRTFDNLLVRIPSESLFKAEITNLTRFPIRRLDVPLGLAYNESPERARRVLEQVAERNELCLTEPKPMFFFLGFGDSTINVRFSVWTLTTHFIDFKARFQTEVKQAFDAEGLVFPFPQRTLSSDSPIAVEVMQPGHNLESADLESAAGVTEPLPSND